MCGMTLYNVQFSRTSIPPRRRRDPCRRNFRGGQHVAGFVEGPAGERLGNRRNQPGDDHALELLLHGLFR